MLHGALNILDTVPDKGYTKSNKGATMIIMNETKISLELIQAVAESMGVNLKASGKLIIEYSVEVNGLADENNGTCQSAEVDGYQCHIIRLLPWAKTETLAHELRHVYQAQVMGCEALHTIYRMEEVIEGYEQNILEFDAREAAKAWRF